jgi:hypothetical protein
MSAGWLRGPSLFFWTLLYRKVAMFNLVWTSSAGTLVPHQPRLVMQRVTYRLTKGVRPLYSFEKFISVS